MSATPASLALYALTPQGAATARRLAAGLPGAQVFLPQALAQPGEQGFARLTQALAANFSAYEGHVVLAATGIVVRALAPLLAHKAQDPAVVVVDQEGRFAISLLSGHLGGANDLARRAAAILGGQPVITTATDLAGLPALELLAAELGLAVENLPALAGAGMALLRGDVLPVRDPEGWLWPVLQERWPGLCRQVDDEEAAGLRGQPLVWVGWQVLTPPPAWLVLRPPALALGLGCNRGTSVEEMEFFLAQTLARQGFAPLAMACLASVEAKRDEAGLLELARRLDVELIFYSAQELAGVEAPNPSPTVLRHMGVASVCEAAAILAARGGPLLLPKHKSPNLTLAVALRAPVAVSGS